MGGPCIHRTVTRSVRMPPPSVYRFAAIVLLATIALLSGAQANARTARTVAKEYDTAIKGAQTIAASGPDLFGEWARQSATGEVICS
jgi:hypothetical protein